MMAAFTRSSPLVDGWAKTDDQSSEPDSTCSPRKPGSRDNSCMLSPLPLPHGEIQVWQAFLDRDRERQGEWAAVLSEDERERARSFRFDVHREWFIAARATLRILLGGYLDVGPETVRFTYGANGKPGVNGSGVHFNASHSEDRALFAFSRDAPLGVDIEAVRPMPDALEIASSSFSPAEAAVLSGLPPELRDRAFFRCWTRKEAVIKALGDGLSYPLDRFSVSFDEAARVTAFDDDPAAVSRWTLYHLEPHPGFVAAVATQAPEARLVLRDAGEREGLVTA